jgi:CHASE3 domain sensor protein
MSDFMTTTTTGSNLLDSLETFNDLKAAEMQRQYALSNGTFDEQMQIASDDNAYGGTLFYLAGLPGDENELIRQAALATFQRRMSRPPKWIRELAAQGIEWAIERCKGDVTP